MRMKKVKIDKGRGGRKLVGVVCDVKKKIDIGNVCLYYEYPKISARKGTKRFKISSENM